MKQNLNLEAHKNHAYKYIYILNNSIKILKAIPQIIQLYKEKTVASLGSPNTSTTNTTRFNRQK